METGGGGVLLKILNKCFGVNRTILCNSQKNKTSNFNYIIENAKDHIVFAEGWHINMPSLVMKYQQVFIDKYTLKEKYYRNNLLFKQIMHKKNEGKIVIGVHIRRGDYRYFENGRYFYTDVVYSKYMDRLTYLNHNCFFVIFSNEKTAFINDSKTIISEEEWYIDQFLMSRCDYLIGPSSTFTLWASYIGKVKYFHIQDEEANITFDNFIHYK
jgi:hypothetical protein